MNAKRIAVMGGSFDPIHHGHLAAAESVRSALNMDYILFIPTGHPPHKEGVSFAEHRYLMTVLATTSNPHFRVSRIETDRSGASYTVDTLRLLRKNTSAELFFIVGADELTQIPNWKEPHNLMKLCSWVVCTRPGYETKETEKNCNILRERYEANIQLLEIPLLDISATEIRHRVAADLSVRYLVPSTVSRYINELELYSKNSSEPMENGKPPCQMKHLHESVAMQLSEERYKHTLGVIESAILLAARHHSNFYKVYLAALLHDYAKEFSEDRKHALCEEYGLVLDNIQKEYINLTHGLLGAEAAIREFGINDPEVLEAIRIHTTGNAHMSLLDKIIKISDNIEPNRSFPEVEAIRALSYNNLDMALVTALKRDMQYNIEKGREIHPLSVAALKSMNMKGE